MKMTRYAVTLTGETDLLMHAHNLSWIGRMEKWRKDPANKPYSVAGDDRTPGYRWIGCLSHDGNAVAMPSDNLMTALREGGSKCLTGNGKQTYKALTQSGLLIDQAAWPLTLKDGRQVAIADVLKLDGEMDYAANEDAVRGLGFELFAKAAAVNSTKHVRVRPRFEAGWSVSGTLTALDQRMTKEVLGTILEMAGFYSGLGDWRPSSPRKPGPFGRFQVKQLKAL